MPTPHDLAQLINIEPDGVPLTTPRGREVPRQFLALSDVLVSIVDSKRAELKLRPLTTAEFRRLGRQVAAIVFPVCTQAEPEI